MTLLAPYHLPTAFSEPIKLNYRKYLAFITGSIFVYSYLLFLVKYSFILKHVAIHIPEINIYGARGNFTFRLVVSWTNSPLRTRTFRRFITVFLFKKQVFKVYF